MEVVEGSFMTSRGRFALVASRFNHAITKRLVEGAYDCLHRHGAEPEILYWVPGAFELPLVAQKLAASGKYDAVICLGAIIRGDTPHFDYVAAQNAAGLMQAGLTTEVPVIYAVLTTDTVEQAEARAGGKSGNKGFDGALTALEMVGLMEHIAQELPCDLRH